MVYSGVFHGANAVVPFVAKSTRAAATGNSNRAVGSAVTGSASCFPVANRYCRRPGDRYRFGKGTTIHP